MTSSGLLLYRLGAGKVGMQKVSRGAQRIIHGISVPSTVSLHTFVFAPAVESTAVLYGFDYGLSDVSPGGRSRSRDIDYHRIRIKPSALASVSLADKIQFTKRVRRLQKRGAL